MRGSVVAKEQAAHAGLGVGVHIDGPSLGHLDAQLLQAQVVHVGAAACSKSEFGGAG